VTQRKPWDLSFDSWIDVQIREAQARGLFDELPGSGRPQASLRDAEDPMWWAKQFLRREQVSYLPPAVEVRVRAQKLREVLASFPSERAVREASEALNEDIRRVNRTAAEGPPTTQAPLDVDDLVAQWRASRAQAASGNAPCPPPAATLNLAGNGRADAPGSPRVRRAIVSRLAGSSRQRE
jgi:hypothetical protein